MSLPCGETKESYQKDMSFIQKRFHWVSLVLLLIVLFTLPFYSGVFIVGLFMAIMSFGIVIMGLNMLTEAGLFSVSHAAFMGIGAFLGSYLSLQLKMPFILVILICGLVTSAVVTMLAFPALRIKVWYLLFLTTATQFTIEWVLNYLTRDIPGSCMYYAKMGSYTIGRSFTLTEKYWIFLILTIVFGYLIAHIARTPLGKAIVMIGERDYAAEVQGINQLKYKAIAFAISGFYAGVGGAMWGYYTGMVTPEHFHYLVSWEMLGVGVIVGGLGSYVWGSLLGTTIMIGVHQGIMALISMYAAKIPWIAATAFGFTAIFYGLVIAGVLIGEPHGMVALLKKIKRFFNLFPFSY